MIPENYFDPLTEEWVALRKTPFGTTKFGYSSTFLGAIEDSSLPESWGPFKVRVFRRTNKTSIVRKQVYQIYEEVNVK